MALMIVNDGYDNMRMTVSTGSESKERIEGDKKRKLETERKQIRT